MATLVINSVADHDVDEIFETIRASSGIGVASAYDRDFDAFYVRLTQFPESGPPRPRLGAGVRIGVVSPYVIVYRFDGTKDLVEILRVALARFRE